MPAVSSLVERKLATRNFLTLDIEEWYHTSYGAVVPPAFANSPTNLDLLVGRLLALFDRYGVKTTCFVLGEVARRSPGVVKRLHSAGHEIACHGYGHRSVFAMTGQEFKADVELSRDVLEDLIGEKVLGFRAPSFSVRRQDLRMFYEVLEETGFRYSSSVFPGKTFLYGIPDFPRFIHYPVVDGVQTRILEIPVPALRVLGWQVGLYIRLFPAFIIRRWIDAQNEEGRPVVLYVHPREIDPAQPRLKLPYLQWRIHYWGIRGCERKVERVLRGLPGRFAMMRELVNPR